MIQFKVISWNIWGGKNLSEIINVLKNEEADIIALQEVLQNEDGSDNNAENIANALGYKWVYEATTLLTPDISHLLKEHGITKKMEWGNAILSKYPIEHKEVHILSVHRKRLALEIVTKISNIDLHIISTHLIYTNLQPSEIQNEQVVNLLKITPKKSSIVMGDFNATPESELIKKMSSIMIDTHSKSLDRCYTYTSETTGIKHKLDYIFITKDMTNSDSGTIETNASDHYPVYSVIKI